MRPDALRSVCRLPVGTLLGTPPDSPLVLFPLLGR